MKNFEKAKIKKQYRSLRRFNIAGYNDVFWYEIPFLPLRILSDWRYERMKWDEKKATKVLDKILPMNLEWVPEDNAFYYCMDWDACGLISKTPFYYKKRDNLFRLPLQGREVYKLSNEENNKVFIKSIEITSIKLIPVREELSFWVVVSCYSSVNIANAKGFVVKHYT